MASEPQISLVLRTLGDPTRRTIFERIATLGEATVGELTRHARVSQPAVSQHLKALAEADLVVGRREGRNVYYRPAPRALDPVADWLRRYAREWEERFDRLDGYLEQMKRSEGKRGRKQ